MNTYYDIFEISPSATQAEIKTAYHKLALKYHPDRNLDKELGDSKMKEINFIYSILSNPEKRRWYDSTTTFNGDYREKEEYSYSHIFCDEIEVVDSKGTKTKLKVGDTIYYLVEIDKSIITWKYKRREYFNLIVKNIFDPEQKDLFATAIKFDFNKTPLCTAHWGNSEMIIYKEDFENYWMSRKSYSKIDKSRGIVTGIFISIVFILGIYYFYSKFSFSAEFYFKKGKTELFDKTDYKNALTHFSKAIELNPTYADAYCNRALTKVNLKDYNGAIQDYDKAIGLNPSDTEAYAGRGMAKYYLGDYKEVIEDYNKVISLNPSSDILSASYNYLGTAKIGLKDFEGAIQALNKAIELDSSIAKAYNNRGYVNGSLGKPESAIRDYNKSIELDSSWAEAYVNRGLEKNQIEDYKGALEDFSKAIKLKPDDAVTYAGRGFTKENLKDYQGAIQDYDKAIELDPNYARTYINRGSAKLELNKTSEACSDFKKAATLGDEGANELIKKHCND
ncbi:MAG: tetratricopeptide repeat protein [Chitinophagaceae bacterium]|nr:tetratricopeptide repeat protein [Chitinophagaceae bacterium]